MNASAIYSGALALLVLAGTSSAQIGSSYCAANSNSTGGPSVISATGSTDVALNDVTLACSALPLNAFGYFVTSQTQAFIPGPGGSSGNLCIGGNIGRYAGNIVSSGATGSVSLTVNVAALPAPTGNYAALPGDTVNFQFWHRDAVGGSVTSNFSPGLEITFDSAGPTFSQDVWPLLSQPNINAPECTICHGSFGGLNLGATPASAYAALVNVASSSFNCQGSIYVVPGDFQNSLLYDKLASPTPSCGSQMPFGGTFAGDVNVIRDWIAAGANF